MSILAGACAQTRIWGSPEAFVEVGGWVHNTGRFILSIDALMILIAKLLANILQKAFSSII